MNDSEYDKAIEEAKAGARTEDKMRKMGYHKQKCPVCKGTGIATGIFTEPNRCCTFCDGKGFDWTSEMMGINVEIYGQNIPQPTPCQLPSGTQDLFGAKAIEGL